VEQSFETHTQGTWTVVAVRGELDLSTSAELRAALDAAREGTRIAVDLTDVSFMDSAASGSCHA
jgi:anti-anti-sigma factor